jgi:periplasmic protein TonB
MQQVAPALPLESQGREVNDVIVLRVLVTERGDVATVNVIRRAQTERGLEDAAVAAVRRWTFRPAQRNGQPVNCWFNVAVPFKTSKP